MKVYFNEKRNEIAVVPEKGEPYKADFEVSIRGFKLICYTNGTALGVTRHPSNKIWYITSRENLDVFKKSTPLTSENRIKDLERELKYIKLTLDK